MKEKNPIDNVRFYMKDNPNEPIKVRKDQVSRPTKGAHRTASIWNSLLSNLTPKLIFFSSKIKIFLEIKYI